MARRSESVAQSEARERLKARFDAEVKAVAEFYGIADRIDGLRKQIEQLELEQSTSVARLVEATDVARAAEVICWPMSKTKEATSRHRAVVESSRGSAPDVGADS